MTELWTTIVGPFTRDPEHAFWVVSVGCMTNVSCALVGCFLVLRRMSLLGDALSHAVLPGLVLAFLLSGSLNIGLLFAGAVAAGLLTTYLTQALHRHGGVNSDAAMGVVFTSLFAFGVLMLESSNLSEVHFDQDCVFEGALDTAALDLVYLGPWQFSRPFLTLAPVLLLNVFCIVALWKEFKISSFDPALAATMGISAGLMHYLLMTLVALSTVASFEAVGSILVVAMLIAPAAAAQLLCDRLSRMLIVATLIGIASAVIGFWMADTWNTYTPGMMTVTAGAIYGLSVFFAPKYGIVSKLIHNAQTSLRILREDILSMLYRLEEMATERQLVPSEARRAVGGGLLARWELFMLRRRAQIRQTPTGLELTEEGRSAARRVVRSHRLWETYLVEHLGLPHDHVHEPAERMEHFITPSLQEEIESELSEKAIDPHGREIPEN